MTKWIELDPAFSTTRHVRMVGSEAIEAEMKATQKPEDLFETLIFLPEGEGRKGEGGLRTHGFFKQSNTEKPLITVITVVLNGEAHLEQTILSVIEQTYDNVEYIVIDGGSTDCTLDIIRNFEHAIDYWVSEKDKGLYDAMNKGIKLAFGDFVGLINADDWYERNIFEKISQNHQGNSLVFGKLQSYLSHGYKITHDIPIPLTKESVRIASVHSTVFMSNDLYKSIGLFDTSYKISADFDLMIRAFLGKALIIKLDTVIAHFRQGGVSSNGKGLREGYEIQKKYKFSKPFLFERYVKLMMMPLKNSLKKIKLLRLIKSTFKREEFT